MATALTTAGVATADEAESWANRALAAELELPPAAPAPNAPASNAPRFQQISAGWYHTCGVLTDGAVACWGSDYAGEATPPSGTFQQVSAGRSHTCGVRTDGAVACWGSGYSGEATPPSGPFQQVSAGEGHTCGILTDGTVACWGSGYSGQATPPSGTFRQVSFGTCGVRTNGTVACWGFSQNAPTPPSGPFQQVSTRYGNTCGVRTDGAVACWSSYSGQAAPPSGTFQQVSLGEAHICGVRTDGTVVCWGSGYSGQATPPSGTFQQVSAGEWHTCGLRTDGTVVCWSYDYSEEAGPPTPEPNGPASDAPRFQQISAGHSHTCGVRTDGAVACWGYNLHGTATPPSGAFRQVSAGWDYTCGVRTDGAVACWGNNEYGQAAPPSGTFRQVSAGWDYTCGVRTDGAVACWGHDEHGEAAPPSGTFRQVSAGWDHTCGVRTDGEVACWGDNKYGQATPPWSWGAFQQVSVGGSYSCGMRTGGEVACWGLDEERLATSLSGAFQQVSAGRDHTCGVRTDGVVACYSRGNTFGEATPPLGAFQQVSAGRNYYTCGVRTDGAVACWGNNSPGAAAPLSGAFQQVSAGRYYTCDLRIDGKVTCWGNNSPLGEATPPSGTFQQVSAGHAHTCGVRTSGAVTCWGGDYHGQATPPSGTFQQVSAGHRHTCGVRTSGAVACWGDDGFDDGSGHVEYGQATPPSGTFQQVSAGWSHTCGVRTDGVVACWGYDGSGQATPPSGTFQQVSAGWDHTCGVRTDGAVVCWGDDEYGQATPPSGTFQQVSAGGGRTCGVRTAGGLACWGALFVGEEATPSGTFQQVSVGRAHTCGVETSGGIVCWGEIVRGNVGPGTVAPSPSPIGDYDADDDGLIEISNLAQLDAVRYDLDGDGAVDNASDAGAYDAAFPKAVANMGCPSTGCIGYELTADLDFDTNGNGRADAGDAYWNDSKGWLPIGADYDNQFTASFDGGGHTIANLYINRSGLRQIGLFDHTDDSAIIRQVGLVSGDVFGGGAGGDVGGLVGYNSGTIMSSYTTVDVSACDHIETDDNLIHCSNGGLVGSNAGTITASYATGSMSACGDIDINDNNLRCRNGGLVGFNKGTIAASYATGDVSGGDLAGGLVGWSLSGSIDGNYATGNVSVVDGFAGGLVGNNYNAAITNSYATGDVSGGDTNGGLVGYNRNATVTASYSIGKVSGYWSGLVGSNLEGTISDNSYWNTQTSGHSTSSGGVGKTTEEMQSPTNDNPGIYATWDASVWDFGDQDEYPTLRNVGAVPPTPSEDYDADDDGLIEVSNLAQLDAIRYDLDGDGGVAVQDYVAYNQAFPDAAAGMGCPSSGCTGYELTAHLDFDTNGNGWIDAGDAYWNGGSGWLPIGDSISRYDAVFHGNGLTITNLHVNRGSSYVGLFGATGGSAVVRRVGLISGSVSGDGRVGSLTGDNSGAIADSYAAVDVSGSLGFVGGLVGDNTGTITGSNAAGAVTGYRNIGGLVGSNSGGIASSYSAGSVSGYEDVGGLAGDNYGNGAITDSYATGSVTRHAGGDGGVGGLVGGNYGSAGAITHSYATGRVTGSSSNVGGLVGYNGDGYDDTGNQISYGSGAVTASYWDTETSGQSSSAGGVGKTTDELQNPTYSDPGIYATWDVTVWDFGGTDQYPTLVNLGVAAPKVGRPSAPRLYWVDEEARKIQRTGQDIYRRVEDQLTAADGLTMPGSIALDPQAGKMYWTDDGAGSIRRANLDGSNVETVKAGLADPVGIALDLNAGYLYWADRHWGAIYRGRLRNVNNLAAETVVDGLAKPYQIALDTFNGHMYWTERGESKIRRADLDGQNVVNIDFQPDQPQNPFGLTWDPVDFRPDQPQNPFGLTLDPIAGKLYWTERSSASTGQDFILSADLDGGNVALVIVSEYHSLSGIAVDVNDGKIYWTDETTGTIRSADPAAADPALTVADVVTDLSAPEGIAVARPYLGNTRLALTALYRATDGDNWTNNDGWLSDALPGTWHGVSVDEQGLITGLYLNDNNLFGKLPAELATLSHLRILNLSGNRLTGSIPTAWADGLDVLLRLNLSDNGLSGPIPAGIGNHHLDTLNLSGNQLSGSIPTELGSLVNLKELNLSHNELSEEIPYQLSSFANLAGCETLGEAPLTQRIIEFLDEQGYVGRLARLETLDLSDNKLSGEIPVMLCSLADLETLDLGRNRLTGTIPPELGKLAELRALRLNGQSPFNKYVFSGQEEEDRLGKCKEECYLRGAIPAELGNLANLEVLDLSHNRLSGAIPNRLGGLLTVRSSLINLNLSHNYLDQEIPVELGRLSNLKILDLSNNDLTGQIPGQPGLGYLTNLDVLHLNGNKFTGCTPHILRHLVSSNLDMLPKLCLITGQQADREALMALYHATKGAAWTLNTLWNTDFPIGIWTGVEVDEETGRVTRLDLGFNNLDGQIPPVLGDLEELEVLRLEGNSLEGCIPQVGNLINALDKGRLEWSVQERERFGARGGDPDASLWSFIYFSTAMYASEWLGGTTGKRVGIHFISPSYSLGLPPCAPSAPPPSVLPQKQNYDSDRLALIAFYEQAGGKNWINRSNWNSNRPLNEWFGIHTKYADTGIDCNNRDANCRVTRMDLSKRVEGLLGSLPNNAGNNLSGTISPQLGSLGQLKYLNLSKNNLTGTIPRELGNLNNLYTLALNDNSLSGEIPAELGNLDGGLLDDLSNASRLLRTHGREILDLHLQNNHLSGRIPQELGNIGYLRTIRVDPQINPQRNDNGTYTTYNLQGCLPPNLVLDTFGVMPKVVFYLLNKAAKEGRKALRAKDILDYDTPTESITNDLANQLEGTRLGRNELRGLEGDDLKKGRERLNRLAGEIVGLGKRTVTYADKHGFFDSKIGPGAIVDVHIQAAALFLESLEKVTSFITDKIERILGVGNRDDVACGPFES